MTQPEQARTRFRLAPMRPRDPDEANRAASPLELFFDLVFVVAVNIAAAQLHHDLTEAHVFDGLVAYAIVFFGIWWAWMNFTWFATSFATDDWLYRILTFVQMAGVLIFAAGIDGAFNGDDYRLLVYGYVIVRIAMVAQWLRAARYPGPSRTAALIYASGIGVVQVLWLVMLTLPAPAVNFVVAVLIVAELAVPIIAEQRGGTPWHPHHITERYGLFTLIVLGESLLASANAIIESLHDDQAVAPLIALGTLALVVTAALWWIYFWAPHHESISTFASSLRYGYTHYFVFGAAGALSAGIEVEIDALTDKAQLSAAQVSLTFTVPVFVFIVGIWWIAIRAYADRLVNITLPGVATLVLLDPLLPIPLTISTAVLALAIFVLIIRSPHESRTSGHNSGA